MSWPASSSWYLVASFLLATPPTVSATTQSSSAGWVTVTEVTGGEGRTQTLSPKSLGGSVEADMGSSLVVAFSAAPPTGRSTLSNAQANQWDTLIKVLDEIKNAVAPLQRQYDELTALAQQVDLSDTMLREYRTRVVSQRHGAENVTRELQSLAGPAALGIVRGTYPGGSQDGKAVWLNIIRWTELELLKLRDTAPREEVVVRAWHCPVRGERRRIHVTNWDRLNSDALQIVPRNALNPEAREKLADANAKMAEIQHAADKAGQALKKANEVATTNVSPAKAELQELVKGEEASASQLLPAAASVTITRDFDELLTGFVDLNRVAGIKENDLVSIQVAVLRRKTAPDEAIDLDDSENYVSTMEYEAKIVIAGWRIDASGALVFLRGSRPEKNAPASSTRTDWKPTAAAIATGNYRFKNPDCWSKQIWNAFDPGLGAHMTAPDMESASVEVGMGLSVGFRKGLLSAGVGWNLTSNSRRTYYFLGMDLFELLRQGEKLRAGVAKQE